MKFSKRVQSSSPAIKKSGLEVSLSHSYFLRRFTIGNALVSLGMFVCATGGSWDISNHLLNKPETFFSAPHAVLYTGVAVAIFGAVIVRMASSSIFNNNLIRHAKLTFTGISMMTIAAPLDFAWHSAFGLDGLLSPPHLVLLLGMIMSSLGAMLGIISYINSAKVPTVIQDNDDVPGKDSTRLEGRRLNSTMLLLIIIGVLPVWMTLDGLIGMCSLPFSNTEYFNFNLDPFTAAVVATIGYPVLISFILCSSSSLANRKFGILSAIGASYLIVHAISTIIPNESLIPTLPFYMLNILAFLASDILVSFSSNKLYSILAGGILGSSFFMIQYPLITYIYSEVFSNQSFVWPSLISSTYFRMISNIYPLILGPCFAMGIIGGILARKITSELAGKQ